MKSVILAIVAVTLTACSTSSPDRTSSAPNAEGLSKAVDDFVEGCVKTAADQNSAPDVFMALGYKTTIKNENKFELRSNVAKVTINRSSNAEGWGQCAVLPFKSNASLLLTLARPRIEAVVGSQNKLNREEAWRVPGTGAIVLWSRSKGGGLVRTQNVLGG